MDDIKQDTPASDSELPFKPGEGAARRTVGPESEVRGGPESADQDKDILADKVQSRSE